MANEHDIRHGVSAISGSLKGSPGVRRRSGEAGQGEYPGLKLAFHYQDLHGQTRGTEPLHSVYCGVPGVGSDETLILRSRGVHVVLSPTLFSSDAQLQADGRLHTCISVPNQER